MTTFTQSLVSKRLATTRIGNTVASIAAVAPGKPVIGTHDGSFHHDEALACAMLHFTSAFPQPAIVRTRVPAELEQCAAVVDVGGVYNESTKRYDHHQPEFQGTMNTGMHEYRTRLSSAGLVYRHYGKEVISNFAAELLSGGVITTLPTEEQVALVYDRVYKNFVEHVDGIDNGVEAYELVGAEGTTATLRKNYSVSTTLSSRVANLHVRWNQKSTPELENERFAIAMRMCAEEFLDAVEYLLAGWLPARRVVESAFDRAVSVHGSSQIVVLDQFAPWKDHLPDLEAERNVQGRTLYVVFPDPKGGGRVQCVPKDGTGFQNRKSLPWRGLRDADLAKASGIEGGVFVHVSGFIGGNRTMDGAIAMAVKAVESTE